MADRLAGKVAIITGAARGQGAATARLFAEQGAYLLLIDRIEDELAEVARSLGPNVMFEVADIARSEAWDHLSALAFDAFDRIDILVNNAAITDHTPFLELTEQRVAQVLSVNLTAPLFAIQSVLPTMLAQRGGSIVNISSCNGLRGMSQMAAYDASKWALRGLTKSIAAEFGHRGVRCNSVHPGAIRTPMLDPTGEVDGNALAHLLRIPAARVGEADEVAAATLFLASDEASYVNGAELAVDGGWTAGFVVPDETASETRINQ